MIAKTCLLATALMAAANAQSFNYIPESITGQFCDGTIRPDWKECQDKFVGWIESKSLEIGPGFLEGTVFTGDKCSLRYVKCGDQEDGWTQDDEMGMFQQATNACGFSAGENVGAVKRQANLCVIVEDPNNRFTPNLGADRVKRDQTRSHPRDLGVSANHPRDAVPALEKRDCSGGGACYTYSQGTWAVNVRGPQEKVCDAILPKGATCTETKSVTITESWTASVDITAGIKEVVDVTAGFSAGTSEAVTTSLATGITVDCDNGGYVVFYPLMEVSTGDLAEGTCNGDLCQNKGVPVPLRVAKPHVKEDGGLTGEYDVQCL